MAIGPAAAAPASTEITRPLFMGRVYLTKDKLIECMNLFAKFVLLKGEQHYNFLPKFENYSWKSKTELAPLDWRVMKDPVVHLPDVNGVAIKYQVEVDNKKIQRVSVFLLGGKPKYTPELSKDEDNFHAGDVCAAYQFEVTDLIDCAKAGSIYAHLMTLFPHSVPKVDPPVLKGAVTTWGGKFVHRNSDLKGCMNRLAKIVYPGHGYGDLPAVEFEWQSPWSLTDKRIKRLHREDLPFPLMTMYGKDGKEALAVVFSRREETQHRVTVFSMENKIDTNPFYIHHYRPGDIPASYHFDITDILDSAQAKAIETEAHEFAQSQDRLKALKDKAPR